MSIPLALRAAYLSMHRQTSAQLAPFHITADQYTCLILLDELDGITQQELVRRATSDPNTIRAMLVLLEKRGLVTRESHPTDGRARIVHITPSGRDLLKQMAASVRPVYEKLIAPFSAKESRILALDLERIAEAMTKQQNIM